MLPVGGLGLNLTAADTVVFMEHDWNPMRDLQVTYFHQLTASTFTHAELKEFGPSHGRLDILLCALLVCSTLEVYTLPLGGSFSVNSEVSSHPPRF